MISYNISEEYSQKLLFGKVTILADLHTETVFLAYHSFGSSSLAPMVNADGSFVTKYKHGRFWFELLDDNKNGDMPVLSQESNKKIAYYHELATGVIYLLHKELGTSSITPLAKPDGTYFTYPEWDKKHSIGEPSPELRERLNRIAK